jgi:hypothetical protein
MNPSISLLFPRARSFLLSPFAKSRFSSKSFVSIYPSRGLEAHFTFDTLPLVLRERIVIFFNKLNLDDSLDILESIESLLAENLKIKQFTVILHEKEGSYHCHILIEYYSSFLFEKIKIPRRCKTFKPIFITYIRSNCMNVLQRRSVTSQSHFISKLMYHGHLKYLMNKSYL